MNTALSWIKAYVPDLECTDQEYRDAMTLSGTKVEGFETLDEDLDKVIVAKVLKIDRHPDADKLIVIENGKMPEAGTHLELINKKGIYYNLYKLQLDAMKNIGIEG